MGEAGLPSRPSAPVLKAGDAAGGKIKKHIPDTTVAAVPGRGAGRGNSKDRGPGLDPASTSRMGRRPVWLKQSGQQRQSGLRTGRTEGPGIEGSVSCRIWV